MPDERSQDGAVPPAAIQDWRYITLSLLAGVTTFFWYPLITRMKSPVQVFDALGLGLFAISGAGKAIAFHLLKIFSIPESNHSLIWEDTEP